MKPYHDYTNYILRQFFAHETVFARDDILSVEDYTKFVLTASEQIAHSQAEKANYTVAALTVKGLPEQQVGILRDVYADSDASIARNVQNCAKKAGMNEKAVWDIVRTVSQEIARMRGLI